MQNLVWAAILLVTCVLIIDSSGQELLFKTARRLHSRGPVSEAGTLGLRAQYSFYSKGTRPTALVTGEARIKLQK